MKIGNFFAELKRRNSTKRMSVKKVSNEGPNRPQSPRFGGWMMFDDVILQKVDDNG
jgi:hypothetical protein